MLECKVREDELPSGIPTTPFAKLLYIEKTWTPALDSVLAVVGSTAPTR